VRWFLLCDGRAGLRLDADGDPVGLDERAFPDMDAAVSLLREHGLQALFELSAFLPRRTRRKLDGGPRLIDSSDAMDPEGQVRHAEQRSAER